MATTCIVNGGLLPNIKFLAFNKRSAKPKVKCF